MSNLLDITGDDIARLNDAELRELIGLLCEADYRRPVCQRKESHGVATRMLAMVGWMLLCATRFPLLALALYPEA